MYSALNLVQNCNNILPNHNMVYNGHHLQHGQVSIRIKTIGWFVSNPNFSDANGVESVLYNGIYNFLISLTLGGLISSPTYKDRFTTLQCFSQIKNKLKLWKFGESMKVAWTIKKLKDLSLKMSFLQDARRLRNTV